ncbi:MAG: biotin/lipoyl-binding protein [Gammaproteobacteria bacterium]|nr:biotin/lipoyl-binding protein [Gammaproteobacteria bacterium]MYD80677.1 biotin/lipoyl-binding protein [Gammaproteobacteria bacterium]
MASVNVESEVTGKVWKIEASIGDNVDEGDVLMILESMKMEIPVESPVSGTVTELRVRKDDSVDEDQVIVVIEQ